MIPESIEELFINPATLGRLACSLRDQTVGPEIQLRDAPSLPSNAIHVVIREGANVPVPAWPDPADVRAGDRWVLAVEPGEAERRRWLDWLGTMAAASIHDVSVAPYSVARGGTHRLWCIAAARLLLPPTCRVEARHDLIDVRLTQIALGFGADTVAGPMLADRRLPLAGVPRPDETTHAGLQSLVQWAGLSVRQVPPQAPQDPQ